MVKIDLKDKKILSELDMNADLPLTQLTKKIGLSRQVVEYRIQRLKKEKVIFGSRGIFDSGIIGYNWYRVMLRFLKITPEEKKKLIDDLKKHPYLSWLGEVGGNWDLVINFVSKDNSHFNEIFNKLKEKYGKYIKDYELLIYINITDLQKTYILNNAKNIRKEFFHEMKENSDAKIDELDKKIIRELSKNSEIGYVELASKFRTVANTIKNRIIAMKKNKVLLGFRLFINPSSLGYISHMLFFDINKTNIKREKEIYDYLKFIPNVTFLVTHLGKWKIGLEIETKSEKEFQEIFVDIRGKFSDIITSFESLPLFEDHVINYFPEGCFE